MAWYHYFRPATMGDLIRIQEALNVDITKLRTDLAALVAKETAAEASEIADLATISQNIIALKANIAAGGSVSQSDLDALDVQVNQVGTGIGTIVTNLDTAAQSDQ